ncbi:MAG: molybdenum cofactor biosynthesis protein MoaE [Candidatus Verstraetearchaeota archaeon]|jgi:molybdopterin synthase catalytic subunit|nr:molybdenum cofactor biosynthesis protein MoaE [Candidatus Verstraetearchaeota archaeon]
MPIGIIAKKEENIDLYSLINKIKDNIKGENCGVIVTFTGIVRHKTLDGKNVEKLEYEVFEEYAKKIINEIVENISKINGVIDVIICHKYGTFLPGEEVLYIVIAAERSEIAIEAMKIALNKAKHEIPIWKKEYTSNGAYWH